MTFRYEKQKLRQGFQHIIGVDEVGKGSLAGPVVAAAVAFAPASLKFKVKSYKGIKDSKLLSPKKREELSSIIKSAAIAWAIAEVEHKIIDRINVHQATLLAMRKAVKDILCHSELVSESILLSIDGQFTIPKIDFPQEAVIDGDSKIISIAAASIIAKVHRDGLMARYHQRFPLYDFARHKGYGTLLHRKMILKHGLCPIHRVSFCGNLAV
jgi:ribonuclease HII